MKKSISILSSFAFVATTLLASTAHASDEFLYKKGTPIVVKDEKPITKNEIDKKIKEIEADFNKNKLPKLDRSFALQKAERAHQVAKQIDNNTPFYSATSTYDENKIKLREGNFLESLLNVEEGMTDWEIVQVGGTAANKARDAAKLEYPYDYMLQDAFRHFSWNYIATNYVGKIKARTATINHEWGMLLLDPITNYYDDKYYEYVRNGDSDPANKAFADAVLYVSILKYELVTVSKSSYSFFKGYFHVSNIMDLHNNCYGRAYSVNEPGLGYRNAFYASKNKGELILNESSVGDSQYKYVWINEWYTY